MENTTTMPPMYAVTRCGGGDFNGMLGLVASLHDAMRLVDADVAGPARDMIAWCYDQKRKRPTPVPRAIPDGHEWVQLGDSEIWSISVDGDHTAWGYRIARIPWADGRYDLYWSVFYAPGELSEARRRAGG